MSHARLHGCHLLTMNLRYKRSEDAKMALEQMDGFELAGRTVSTIHVNQTTSANIGSLAPGQHRP